MICAVLVQLADVLDPTCDVIETMDLLVQSAVRFTATVEAGIAWRMRTANCTSSCLADDESTNADPS